MRTHNAHAARYFFIANDHYRDRAISINIIVFSAWFHRRIGFQPTETRSLCKDNCFANERKLGPGNTHKCFIVFSELKYYRSLFLACG